MKRDQQTSDAIVILMKRKKKAEEDEMKKKDKKPVPESEMSEVVLIKKRHRYPPAMTRYIRNIAKDLQRRMGLTEYKVDIQFIETDFAAGRTSIQTASTIIDCIYLTVMIYIRPSLREDWECKEYKVVCNIVIHELCHIYFEPIYDKCVKHIPGGVDNPDMGDIVECQVQRLANAWQKLLPKDYHMPHRWMGNEDTK